MGRRGLDALVARYGAGVLKDCIAEMIRRSEAEMRSYIAEIPDGAYRITDYFDNDGVDDKPLAVALTLTVSGSNFGSTGPNIVMMEDFERDTAGQKVQLAGAPVGAWTAYNSSNTFLASPSAWASPVAS